MLIHIGVVKPSCSHGKVLRNGILTLHPSELSSVMALPRGTTRVYTTIRLFNLLDLDGLISSNAFFYGP